jgi:hypothetical protein
MCSGLAATKFWDKRCSNGCRLGRMRERATLVIACSRKLFHVICHSLSPSLPGYSEALTLWLWDVLEDSHLQNDRVWYQVAFTLDGTVTPAVSFGKTKQTTTYANGEIDSLAADLAKVAVNGLPGLCVEVIE